MQNIECPICKGVGKIEYPKDRAIDFKKRAVKILHNHEFGVRQIQRLLGYKSPRSVAVILEDTKPQ